MKYFKGSKRRVRKSTSLLVSSRNESELEAENASTSNQAAVSPKSERNERTQRKRSRASEKAEVETSTTEGSKKKKVQRSSTKTSVSGKRRTQTAKNKSSRKATGQDEAVSSVTTSRQRSKQLNQSDQLSTSESERNLTVLCDTDEHQSDRNFLQQQIKILKTPFQIEEDCPALAGIRANDSKHIPLDVIHNTLRKVNHKTEDEILRSLNRHAQRKLLSTLQDTRYERHDPEASHVSDEQTLERYNEVCTRVANLEKAHDEIKQQHAQYKHIGDFLSRLELASEEFSSKMLTEEVKKTNNLLGVRTGLGVSDIHVSPPSTHEQLVQILFRD